jgi:peptidoglycan/LPS O-acetylase OafA/YrhL
MPRDEHIRPPGRLAALDGLRLLAAVAVAVYHYTVSWRIDGVHVPEYFLPTAAHVTVYGFLGVELFFLISGFVICMSCWGRPLGAYFTSRVSRLYPAYWACLVVTAGFVALVPMTGGLPVEGVPTLTEVALNATMLQQPLGVPSVDTVYWTLFVELRFYLLFAVVVWTGLTYRRAVLFCAVWLTVAVLCPAWDLPVVDLIVIPDYAPYFVAGIAMYLIHRFGATALLVGVVGMAWLVGLERVGDRMADIHPGFPVPAWPGHLVVTLSFAVLLAVALGWANGIRWRWLTVAGAVTYPFYLLHQRIGYGVIRTAYVGSELPVWFIVVLALVVVGGLAWLVQRYVERPLTPVLRTALRRGIEAVRDAEPTARRDVAPRAAGTRPAAGRPITGPGRSGRRSAGTDQPGLVREDHELGPVADPELRHRPVHVGLGGERRQEEPFGDVVVGQAVGHQGQHLPFPVGEPVERQRVRQRPRFRLAEEPADQPARRPGGQQRVAGGDDPDGVHQRAGVGALAEEAAGARAQSQDDVVVVLEGGEHEDLHAGEIVVGGDAAGRLDPVHHGHPDVHEHDVGAGAAGQVDGLPAVEGLADDVDVRLGVEDQPEARPDQGLVVGEQHPDAHGVTGSRSAAAGRTACTANPPSGDGCAVTVPPAAAARSRMPTMPYPPPLPVRPGATGFVRSTVRPSGV